MPKVLITNGSVLGTWYEGKEGTLYDVNYSSEHNHMLKEDEGPAVFQRGVAKADGVLLYTGAEYNELHSAYNELRRQRDKVIDDLTQHAETIKNLREESAMLLQQIERTVDEQKVELPREVAGAIDELKENGIAPWAIFSQSLSGFYPRLSNLSDKYDTVRRYGTALSKQAMNLMNALVNGYTIEPEPRDKVKQFIEKWYGDPGDVTDAELYELSDGIIDLLQTSSS